MLSNFFARRETLLAFAILVLAAVMVTRYASFASPANLASIFDDTAILFILALGQMAVILTRSIDLSVAANLAFTGMAVAMLNAFHPDIPLPLLVVFSGVMGLALGAFNGLLVWKLNMPSIVATLGTLTIYRGMAFVISGGAWVNTNQFSAVFLNTPRLELFGITALSWFAVIIIALAVLIYDHTPVGRAFFAVGGNPTASVYAGLDVGRTRFHAFCLSGLLSGLSAYLWVARYAVAYVDLASGFELDVIAACVIGGVSIAGGIGSVGGAVLGALFLGVIKNALPVANISPFWQMAISGGIIIAAVAINARSERVKGRIILRPKTHAIPSAGVTP